MVKDTCDMSECSCLLPCRCALLRQINVNNMVHMFFSAFTWGYALCFVTEVSPRYSTHVDTIDFASTYGQYIEWTGHIST